MCGTNAAGDRRAAEAQRSSKIDDLVDIEANHVAGGSRELCVKPGDPGNEDKVARSHILEAYVRERLEEEAWISAPLRGLDYLAMSIRKQEARQHVGLGP